MHTVHLKFFPISVILCLFLFFFFHFSFLIVSIVISSGSLILLSTVFSFLLISSNIFFSQPLSLGAWFSSFSRRYLTYLYLTFKHTRYNYINCFNVSANFNLGEFWLVFLLTMDHNFLFSYMPSNFLLDASYY